MEIKKEIRKDFAISFCRLSEFMGDDMYKEIMSATFDKLYKYESALCPWIENEIIEKVAVIDDYFKDIGLYNRDLQAQMFLRLYYVFEREKIKRIKQN